MTLLAIFAYLAIQLGIGLWVSRRIRTEEDYLIAGRRLGYTRATFSIFATWFGAETIIGSGGRALREGRNGQLQLHFTAEDAESAENSSAKAFEKAPAAVVPPRPLRPLR